MLKESSSQLRVIGVLILSVVSSIANLSCSNYLINHLGFYFGVTTAILTSWYLIVTFCVLHFARRLKFFETKPIDLQTIVVLGALNGISIGLNVCLAFHSIGFYQMTKLTMIPFTVLLESAFLDKKFSLTVKASLVILLIGVGVASITDLHLHVLGAVLSILAIAATSTSQILINQIHKRLKISSTQLLYQSALYQAAVLFMTGLFVDKHLTMHIIFKFKYTLQALAFFVLASLVAVVVKFSAFFVIGATSPVTYQVLGHLKTCLILSSGYVLSKDPFTVENIIGILVAVFGMVLYTYFSVTDTKEKSERAGLIAATQEMAEKDPALLLSLKSSMEEQNGRVIDAEGGNEFIKAAKATYSR